MKPKGRVRLTCFKKLPSGVLDKFVVIVTVDKKDAAKKEYEAQGYKVVG